jgi:hypothetical protein
MKIRTVTLDEESLEILNKMPHSFNFSGFVRDKIRELKPKILPNTIPLES